MRKQTGRSRLPLLMNPHSVATCTRSREHPSHWFLPLSPPSVLTAVSESVSPESTVRTSGNDCDIHRAELQSTYFVVHPGSKPTTGVALIEAISAGCLVLAPPECVLGFPELLSPELEFSGVDRLLELVDALEGDSRTRELHREEQQRRVEEWCYRNPARNLETMLQAFRSSAASSRTQRRAEVRARLRAQCERLALRARRRVHTGS